MGFKGPLCEACHSSSPMAGGERCEPPGGLPERRRSLCAPGRQTPITGVRLLAVAWIAFALFLPICSTGQTIDMSLDLHYSDPSSTASAGNWELIAKATHRGIQGLVVHLQDVASSPQFEAPTGTGTGVSVAGFQEIFAGGSQPFYIQHMDHLELIFTQSPVSAPGPQGLFYDVGVVGGATQPGENGTPAIAGFSSMEGVPWNYFDVLGDQQDDGLVNHSGPFEGGVILASGTFGAHSNPDFFSGESSEGQVLTGQGTASDPPQSSDISIATLNLQIRDNTFLSASPSCDFNGDLACDVTDLDFMYAQGDLHAGIPVSGGKAIYNLVQDSVLDGQDLNQFLAAAANEHGYGSPFVRGDTDDVGPGTSRDVDITDFNALAANFDPTAANGPTNTWGKGNFDGDRDIDITDFNSLAANFSPTGYAVTSQVPEPSMFSQFFVGMGLCICLRRGR